MTIQNARAWLPVLAATALTVAFPSVARQAGEDPSAHGPDGPAADTITVIGERQDAGYGADTSSSAGKIPLDLMKTPQAVQVVSEQLIEDFQPIFLDDALRAVSGVNQTNTFGNTADGITIRGFQPFEYFRNGVRTISSRNLTPSTERIEILKGPSSLLYGNVEPGGLVNVISKRPEFGAAFTDVRYQASDRGGNRWNLDTGAPLPLAPEHGQLAWRLIVDRDGSDYWRNFGSYDNTFVAPTLSYRNDRLRVTAAYEFSDLDGPFDRGTVVVGDRIADIPQTRRLGEDFEKLTEKINLGELDLEYDWTPTTTLRLRGTWQDRDSDDLQARPRFVRTDADDNPVLVRRVDGTFGRYQETRYLSASVLHVRSTGPLAHQVLIGVDHEKTEEGRAGFLVGPDEATEDALRIFDPVYGTLDVREGVVAIGTGPFASDGDTTGIYLQDVIGLGAHWTLLLGARHESYDSESVTANVDGATVSDDSTLLPRVGLVFQPRPWVSVYASQSESFRPNVFNPANFAPGSPTAFDPEEGVSREAGVKLRLGRVELTGAVFDIEKRNVIEVDNMVPRLVDAAEVQGVEFDLAGEPFPWLSLMLAYAYQDSDDGNGRPIRNVAEHTAGLTATWRQLAGPLRGAAAGASLQYVDDRDGGANPGASPGGPEFFNVPHYTVADLFAAYEWRTVLAPVRLQLNLKNAFDEDYFPSSGGSLRINPGQSRTLYASVSLRF